ncbi:MAG: DUF1501 domain-containing protein [Planctomycetia bacterium]|nr:DUF1501 domain-containing protein [Planctomycetia bacterium]
MSRNTHDQGVAHCSGPVTRRDAMKFGSVALGSLGLGEVLRMQSQAATASAPQAPNGQAPNGKGTNRKDENAVIFIWLPGGPPHMEMYDLKPNAPLEYRGDFNPIASKVPGLDVGELLPLHAKCADKFTVIRSIAHKFADHGGGHKRFMMARDPKEPAGTINDFPAVPSLISKIFEKRQRGIPNYVCAVDGGRQQIDTFAFGSAYLSSSTHPFTVAGDPSSPTFKIDNIAPTPSLEGRMNDRIALLNKFDNWRRRIDESDAMDTLDVFNRRALELVTSDRARKAFDLASEPAAVRDRYGRHAYGQRALMARRLVESGVTFVTMTMENPCIPGGNPNYVSYNWDSHAVNCHLFADAKVRFPMYDQAVTALIEDLYSRGLDKRVLLVVTGEFGRTPKVNYQIGTQTGVMQPGRDHWPNSMSMIVSGGGMRTGQIVGATNAKGEYPTERPMSPNDLWASVFAHLGIDPENTFPDHNGRPMPLLPFGAAIPELMAVS